MTAIPTPARTGPQSAIAFLSRGSTQLGLFAILILLWVTLDRKSVV